MGSFSNYLSDKLQLRSFVNNKLAKMGLLFMYVSVFVVYTILIWGRPDGDYWVDEAESLGGEVNLTICEVPEIGEFTRLPSNALSTICPIYVGIFIILMFVLDIREKGDYAAGIGFRPASIVLRFPIWSLFIGLNFLFLGASGFFFFASTMDVANTVFTVAQWSTILALCIVAVNRLLDPPAKQVGKFRAAFGVFLTFISIVFHLTLTVFLVRTLNDSDGTEEDGEDEEVLPTAILYALVVLAVFCAVVHWRSHSLSIDQQPVLLFLGGLLAVVAAGCASYDNADGDLCTGTAFFQIGSFGFFLLNISATIAYCFLRADQWSVKGERITSEARHSLPPPIIPVDEGQNDDNEVRPEPLSPNQNVEENKPQSKTQRQLDYIINMGSKRIRRATTDIANSRIVTPELGFSPAQIRAGECIIGLVIIAFIIVVIYFTFTAD